METQEFEIGKCDHCGKSPTKLYEHTDGLWNQMKLCAKCNKLIQTQ